MEYKLVTVYWVMVPGALRPELIAHSLLEAVLWAKGRVGQAVRIKPQLELGPR